MNTAELLQEGRLADAIAAQIAAVKADPLDEEQRYLLFALFGFAGDWERAGRQLNALGMKDRKLNAAAMVYAGLLESENERRAVFQGTAQPVLPPETSDHIQQRLAVVAAVASEQFAEANTMLESVVETCPTLSGRINGKEFKGFRDLDDTLGSVLEVMAGGHYLWMPFEQIVKLELQPPKHLLDLLWLPATLDDTRGVQAFVHLPVCYCDSAASEDQLIQLGRKTDWLDQGGFFYRGLGQRLFAFLADGQQQSELTILDVRTLEFDQNS